MVQKILPVAAFILMVCSSGFAGEVLAMKETSQKATFAGGCFWGIEKYFGELEGVTATRVGYTGGKLPKPSYEAVCTGVTGHAEAIELTFNPAIVSYNDLLAFFFALHDPTTLNRQGNDVGTQYRSAIFYHTPEQEKAVRFAIEALTGASVFKKPIVTTIEPAGEFYAAEEYHQKYLKKNPGGYCNIHFAGPKVAQVLKAANPKKS